MNELVLDPEVRACANAFRALYERSGALDRATWLGEPVPRFPIDLWIYQEIVAETRPDVVAVSGPEAGPVALYLDSVLRLLGAGRAVAGDGADALAREIHPGERVMVIAAPEAGDLGAHAALVGDGCYLVAERADPDHVSGLLAAGAPLEIDRTRERMLATFNPSGYLRRTEGARATAARSPSRKRSPGRTPSTSSTVSSTSSAGRPGSRTPGWGHVRSSARSTCGRIRSCCTGSSRT